VSTDDPTSRGTRTAVRRRWTVFAALILVFIIGYVGDAAVCWTRHYDWSTLNVPVVFCCGAWFVWLAPTLSLQTLSLQTVIDLRRVTLLEQESITESLTGIYNRRYLYRRLEEEFGRARRYVLPLTVLLLDIDHFKRVNDTYGHQAGDRVLSDLVKLALRAIRTSNIVARYGGEELLVITPNNSAASAGTLAERLCHIVESHTLVLTSEASHLQELRIRVSIGVAGAGQEVDSRQKVVQQADEALHRATPEGRNRVVVTSRVGMNHARSAGAAAPG